jgi:hypothetical protein
MAGGSRPGIIHQGPDAGSRPGSPTGRPHHAAPCAGLVTTRDPSYGSAASMHHRRHESGCGSHNNGSHNNGVSVWRNASCGAW